MRLRRACADVATDPIRGSDQHLLPIGFANRFKNAELRNGHHVDASLGGDTRGLANIGLDSTAFDRLDCLSWCEEP